MLIAEIIRLYMQMMTADEIVAYRYTYSSWGDVLVLLDSSTVIVDSVCSTTLEEPITVYNFEVEDFHTYFVGNDGWLVHNSCRNKEIKQIAKAYNMTELERHEFGDYVEAYKKDCGMPPNHHLPYVELKQLAEEFLGGKP